MMDRSRGQAGFTLLESMTALALSALVLVPLVGWTYFAMSEPARTGDRTEDVAAVGRLRTTFSRDVASAASAATSGTDCTDGAGSGGTVELVLVTAGVPADRIVYSAAPSVVDGVVSSATDSLWRRQCSNDGSGSTASVQLITGIRGGVTVSCSARPSVPPPDVCGQVRLETTTAENNELVKLSGARRIDGVATSAPSGVGKKSPIAKIELAKSDPNGYRDLVVNFDGSGSSDPDGTIASYYWEFGTGGATSTDVSPTFTYTEVGIYTVSLTVTDNDGAPKTAYTNVQVVNRLPVAVIANSPASLTGDKDLTVAFSSTGSTDAADPNGAITGYLWNFGDGSPTSTNANPTHVYTKKGTYSVVLTVTDNDGGTSTATRDVVVTNPPPIVQSLSFQCSSNTTPCSPGTNNSAIGTIVGNAFVASFTTSASDPDGGQIEEYKWSVTPAVSISDPAVKSPTISFPAAGNYVVGVSARDSDGDWSTEVVRTVKVNSPPTALFSKSLSDSNGYRPLSASVDASASGDTDGGIQSYLWSTGDGQSGSGTTATFSYPPVSLAGTKSITLSVTDTNGYTVTNTQTFVVNNRAPVSVISVNPNPAVGPKPLAISFGSSGSHDPDGTPITYKWIVDGATAGTGLTLNRTFTTTATYVVSLTVTDIDNATHTSTVLVKPGNVAPTAGIAFGCTTGTVPCTPSLDNSMIGTLSSASTPSFAAVFSGSGTETDGGTITGYDWAVTPSASISNASTQNPTITFASWGTYTVKLRVKDNDGTWSPWVQKTVRVNAPPTASVSLPATGRAPHSATFTQTASDPEGTALTYAWTFGTAGTSNSSASSVAVNFASPGVYQVTLAVTDGNGGIFTTTAQHYTVTGAPYPTLTGTGSGCQGFLCTKSRWLDLTWNQVPQVDQYEIKFAESNLGCGTPGNVTISNGATTSVKVGTSCVITAEYRIQIRARDSVTGLWSEWSPEVKVNS